MKNNKVFLYTLVMLMLVLSACQAVPQPTTPVQTDLSTSTATGSGLPEAADPTKPGCLGSADQAIVDLNCREITVAVENAYLPFNYIEIKTGEPAGWDYEVLTQICTLLHCSPVFVETGWDGLIQSVADGLNDMGADGLTITDERKQIVDFSDGYLQIIQRVLVRAGENRFDSLEALAKDETLTVGTQSGTSNYNTTIKYVPAERVKAFEQMPFAIQALLSKDVDAVVIDEVAGLGYQGLDQDKLSFVGPSLSSDELGFLFPKGSDLVGPINQAIAALKESGVLTEINLKYFGPDFDVTTEDIQQ